MANRKSYGELSSLERAKASARAYLNVYVRRGKIVPQPCEDCGSMPTEAHHDDYSKPLQVRWKCRQCHRAHHKAEALHVEPRSLSALEVVEVKQRNFQMRTRRKDITPEEIEIMRKMEANGESRKAICLAIGCSPSVVTRHLGAVRQYKGMRLPKAA